jgi:hypothetical protein
MTIHNPKANIGFSDRIEDEERLADLICSQIHCLVSQLHQHGKPHPEQISQRLWDLVDAVKHIAAQYADDHLSHSMSSADHQRDDESTNCSPVSSNRPCSGNLGDWESWSPLPDLFSIPLSACTTDGNNRGLSESLPDNLHFPNPPSNAADPGTTLPHDELSDVIQEPWQCPLPLDDDIFNWIERKYKESRDFEVNIFNSSIFSTLFQKQTFK